MNCKRERTLPERIKYCIYKRHFAPVCTSGGLIEISENEIGISPEGNGAEITIFYYERIGLMGEHAPTHQSGGTDIIVVDEAMLQTALKNKLNGKITGVGVGK